MSKNNSPFSINIFLPNGDPDGLRVIGKSHWTGRGIVFTRSGYEEASKRDEFRKAGVYILVGDSGDGGLPTIYIGEGETVNDRFKKHNLDKDFWDWGVFFVSTDDSLNKAHVKYFESRLIAIAQKTKRATLNNSQTPKEPILSEFEKAHAESFLNDILVILPLIELNVFKTSNKKTSSKYPTLYLSTKGLNAQGQCIGKEFTVFTGSQIHQDTTNSIHAYMVKLREDLTNSGVISEKGGKLIFTQNYTFSSPSTASGVILGRADNGRMTWKTKEGKTLKELQEAQLSNNLDSEE